MDLPSQLIQRDRLRDRSPYYRVCDLGFGKVLDIAGQENDGKFGPQVPEDPGSFRSASSLWRAVMSTTEDRKNIPCSVATGVSPISTGTREHPAVLVHHEEAARG